MTLTGLELEGIRFDQNAQLDAECIIWRITDAGCFIDAIKLSDVTLDQLDLASHHSMRLRIGIDEDAAHPGGVNIFGRGFGNYDQDIVMRIRLRRPAGGPVGAMSIS